MRSWVSKLHHHVVHDTATWQRNTWNTLNIHNNPYFNDERKKKKKKKTIFFLLFVLLNVGLHKGEPREINIIKKITTKAIKKLQSMFEMVWKIIRQEEDTMHQ